MPDQLDDLLAQSQQDLEKVNGLQTGLSYGVQQDPTQARSQQVTARALGVTPDLVQQDPQGFNRAARLSNFDFNAFVRQYPKTTAIATNPFNAAAMHDDLETYKDLEDQFDKRTQAGDFKGLTASQLEAVKQDAINRGVYNSKLSSDGEIMADITDKIGDVNRAFFGPFTEFAKSLTPSPDEVTKVRGGLPWWLDPGALVHAAADKIEWLLSTGQMASAPQQLKDPATGKLFDNPLYKAPSILGQVPGMVGTLGAMVAGGKFTAPLFAFNADKAKFDEVMAKTGSLWKASVEGLGTGLANLALFTQVPGPVTVEGQSILKTAATQTARAVPLSMGMTAIDNTLRQLHEPDGNLWKGWSNQFITFALYENVHTVNAIGDSLVKSHQNMQYMNDLADTMKRSRVLAEDPQAFRDHLAQLADGAEVAIPAREFTRYWQGQGEDPVAKAQEMGIGNFEEANATATDLRVPVDKFLTSTVDTPHFDGLAKDVRLTPGGLTMNEADAQAERLVQNVQAAKDQLQKMSETDTPHPDREAIQDKIKQQLLDAGGEAAKTADATSKIFTNFAINFAERASGKTPDLITPKDIAARLDIGRGLPTPGASDGLPTDGRRAQGPVRGNAGSGQAARGLTAPEHEDVRAARVADLQGRDGAEVLAFTKLGDLKGAERTDLTTPRLGLPATGYVDGDQLGVSVYKDGVHAWVTAQVRDGHLYTGTLDQSSDTGIPGIGTDLLQSLGQLAVERFPELKDGNLYGVAGGKMRGGQLYSEGIERTRNRFTNTIWDGVKVSTPISDLLNTDFNSPIDVKGDGGDPMGRMLYQSGPVFYSALDRAVQDPAIEKLAGRDGTANTEQVRSWLAARQKEGKFKQAEMDAIGVNDYLDLQGKTTGIDELRQFIQEGGVRVEEKILGEGEPMQFLPTQELRNAVLKLEGVGDINVMAPAEAYSQSHPFAIDGDPATLSDVIKFTEAAEDSGFITSRQAANARFAAIDLEAHFFELVSNSNTTDTKYQDYTLPGPKDNYKEVLLTLPVKPLPPGVMGKPESFQSSHFDQQNILAHVRLDERPGPNGERMLFIEEVQSDWAQKGRKEGFKGDVPRNEQIKILQDSGWHVESTPFDWSAPSDDPTNQGFHAQKYLNMPGPRFRTEDEAWLWVLNNEMESKKVPTAPFVTDTKAWTSLAVKRLLRYAVDNGLDQVAFVTGQQSADRYNLAQAVSAIGWSGRTNREGDRTVALQADGGNINMNVDKDGVIKTATRHPDELVGKTLEEVAGKEVSEKILASDPEKHGEIRKDELMTLGGQGMKAFYDKLLPSVVNDVVKKLGGGKLETLKVATDETPKAGGAADTTYTDQLGLKITPEMKAKIEAGQALFQPPTAGNGGERGYLEFQKQDGGKTKFNLGLLNDDKSTPIHELGHFYLEMLHELSGTEGVSYQVKSDYGVIRKWLGAEGDAPLTVDQHEQFARAHETYMREGKAPSEDLRTPFQRFSGWLMKIYKTAEQLHVPMTDEVRGVFDRLYASDQEIEAARKTLGDIPLFTSAKDMGVSEKEFLVYLKAKQDEISTAKERLLTTLAKQHADQQRRDWRENLAEKRVQVADELDKDPAYIALRALTTGATEDGTEVKLSRQAIIDRYGEEKLKELGRGKGYVYTHDGGMDPDAAAVLLGFDSGNDLINAISGLEARGKRIDREANARMLTEHGDLMSDDAALRAKAVDELHSTRREDVLALELRSLNRLKRTADTVSNMRGREVDQQRRADETANQQDRALLNKTSNQQDTTARKAAADEIPPMRSFRIAASAFVDHQPLANTDPNKYLLAQRRLAREAFDLQGKNKYADAAEAKTQEILNHFMYLEAKRARAADDKLEDLTKKLASPRVQGNLGKAGGTYQAQVNTLLQRFGYADADPNAPPRKETLQQWVDAQLADNKEPVIADKLLDEGFKVPHKQMTNADLRDLSDAFKNIKHLAYQEFNVLLDGKRVDYKDLVAELDSSARANNKETPLKLPNSTESAKDKAIRKLQSADSEMVKAEQIINWLDGNDPNGPWHRAIWDPIVKAQNADYDLIIKVNQKLMEAMDQMPKEQQNSMLDTFTVPGVKGDLNRMQIITMLFNMGTDLNRQKLIEGYSDFGFTPATVDAALSNLNHHDTKFVQGAWDTLEMLWPDVAALHKRMTGLDLQKQERVPVTVNFKDGTSETLDGGYFPLVGAPGRSTVAVKQESNATALFDYGGGYTKAITPQSHTKERTGAIYPLSLDYHTTLLSHTSGVVKDLTHRESVILINRLLGNPEVRRSMQETVGEAYYKQLAPWLRNIVNDRASRMPEAASRYTDTMLAARGNLVASVLGFKYSTVIVQLTDTFRVVGPGEYRVPVSTFAGAFMDFLRHPNDVTNQIHALSGEMQHRPENLDRDMRAQWEHLRGDGSLKAEWNRKAFHGLAMIDALISKPAWLGSYRDAISKGNDPDTAARMADRTVRLTLMAGNPKDLLAAQRNPDKAMKLITMFMGDGPAQYGLLRNAVHAGSIPQFTAIAVMMSLANIIGDSLKGQTPQPNEDKRLWAARKAALAWTQPIPIVRDVANAMDAKVFGTGFGGDYRLSPIVSVMQKGINLVDDTVKVASGKEEYPDYFVKAFDELGTLLGIGGTSQAAASAKYLRRVQTGEEHPANAGELIYNTMVGKPRSKR